MARPHKHRHWSAEEKRSICVQTRAQEVSVAQVARRYALNANLIFKWLKDPRYAPGDTTSDTQAFLPVEISTQASVDLVPVIDAGSAAASGGDRGQVEIILSCRLCHHCSPFDVYESPAKVQSFRRRAAFSCTASIR